jgi:hypothetical protein
MARSQARKQRHRIRQLETELARLQGQPIRQTPRHVRAALQPWSPVPPGALQKAQDPLPVPATSRDLVYPIYPSQIPLLEPYQLPDTYGAFQRGRLFQGYGSGVSFELLRLALKRCLLLQAIHSCCLHDMLQLTPQARTPEELGWRVEHLAAVDEGINTDTPEIRARCARIARRLAVPHPIYEESFSGFLAKIMQDYLTINRVAIELIRNGRGEIVQFRAVDGATILPTYRVIQRFLSLRGEDDGRPLAYEVAARVLEQETGHPFLDSEYVCVMRGQLVGTFLPGELLVWEHAPTTDVREIFPPSYAERALEGIISWLHAFHYNRAYFSHGNPIEVILGVSGEMEDDAFVTLQEQLRENFSGLKGAWRVPLVQLPTEGALSVIHLKQNHREMQFDQWMMTLTSLVCAIYRISTRRIELRGRSGEGRVMFEHTRAAEIESSQEESFRIHSAFLGEKLSALVRLMDPELCFAWSGLDVEDRTAEIAVETQEVGHYRSINEIRLRHGDTPMDAPWAQVPLHPLVFQAAGLTGGGDSPGPGEEETTPADTDASKADAPAGEPEAFGKALAWEEIYV